MSVKSHKNMPGMSFTCEFLYKTIMIHINMQHMLTTRNLTLKIMIFSVVGSIFDAHFKSKMTYMV